MKQTCQIKEEIDIIKKSVDNISDKIEMLHFEGYTCICPNCSKLIKYYMFNLEGETYNLTCGDCGLYLLVGKNGKVIKVLSERTHIYARGGRGNSKLLGFEYTHNDSHDFFSSGARGYGYCKGTQQDKSCDDRIVATPSRSRILTTPMTSKRTGRWIRKQNLK